MVNQGSVGHACPRSEGKQGYELRPFPSTQLIFLCATKHVRPVEETGSSDLGGGLAELVRKSGAQS